MDSREAEAAHRLAKGFADEKEWSLVDVVARRTIEGEGGLDGGLQGTEESVAGKYLPTNAWAWKALGVVNLVSKSLMSRSSTGFIPTKDGSELHTRYRCASSSSES